MFETRKYNIGFDLWGLVLFLAIMLPNGIWFLLPAPRDILRSASNTAVIDAVASVFQVIMVAAICMLRNTTGGSPMDVGWKYGITVAVLLYFAGWVLYYAGMTNVVVIMDLCVAPCVAFILFALARKNTVALVAAIGFIVCHMYYGIMNFVLK